MTSPFRDLADRCIGTIESLRAIDADIHVALGLAKYTGNDLHMPGKVSVVGSEFWQDAPPYTSSLGIAFSFVPDDWWLHRACEDRTEVRFAGDRHEAMGTFTANVQHVKGGRLREARAPTLARAICAAACLARCPS